MLVWLAYYRNCRCMYMEMLCAKGAGGGDASCVLRVLVEGMPHVC